MRVVAYVDAMYRLTDKQAGYGFLVEQIDGSTAVTILVGNKSLPFSRQGSAQTEIMAIEDFVSRFASSLSVPLHCIYTDSEGILGHLNHIRTRVRWMRRDSVKIQTAHAMAQKLRHLPELVDIPPCGISTFHCARP